MIKDECRWRFVLTNLQKVLNFVEIKTKVEK